MTIITDQKLIINENYEDQINKHKIPTSKKKSIPYRDWREDQPVFKLPIEFCRFRLENGRISIEVSSHKATINPLDPNSPEDQKKIFGYLQSSDREKNKVLSNLLKKDGQTSPAVITADGFLINGNRRRMLLESLFNETYDEKFKFIDVCILPGKNDPERPTLKDIAMLEYRYQVQDDGKSDYTEMAKAITTRNYVNAGLPLPQMLRDDPKYSELDDKPFNRDVKAFERDYLGTLDLIDDYLSENQMVGNYKFMETRWESFKELNQKIMSKLKNDELDEKYLAKYNIDEDEIGDLRAACFNIIKLKNPQIINKNRHTDLIRAINPWLSNSKKEFLELAEIGDVSDEITNPREREKKWEETKAELVENTVKKIQALSNKKKEQQGPINKLKQILSMLEHDYLDEDQIKRMPIPELDTAIKITNSIQTANKSLQQTFYDLKDNKSPHALKKHFENK